MKLVSWNVNGIRACVNKGFLDFFNEVDADMFCIQESKCQEGQIELPLEGYHQYWNYAEKKGYSGTAIFTKRKPLSVSYGVGDKDSEEEGRIITLEFEKYFVVNVYTPNAKRTLERLEERLEWEDEIREYLISLKREKPVIYCGDLNVAHQEIDLKNAKTNKGNSGFTEEERGKMTELLNHGFIDTFRFLFPEKTGSYSWWSYMSKVRERNIGWRIDYVIVSENIKDTIIDADIHHSILGSDHCPVSLEFNEEKITNINSDIR
jgi:exodeoxyribonuclease III